MTVRLYTVGDRVELRLNGAAVASRAVAAADLRHVELQVPYAPGALEAVALRNGGEIGRRRLETVGAPAAVRLSPERPTGGAGRGDVSFVAVEILDAQGRVTPDVVRDIELTVLGPAQLVGFGSANPLAVGGFQARAAKTWNGRALAILRGTGRAGAVGLQATSGGLASGAATLRFG